MVLAIRAGLAYFVIVFGLGFLLGTFRVLVLLPRIPQTVAVMLELPLMLVLSWIVALRLIGRFRVPARLSARIVMGCLASALLMQGEAAVAALAFGRTFSEHLVHYTEASALLGLAGQITFAIFPVVELAVHTRNKLSGSQKGHYRRHNRSFY